MISIFNGTERRLGENATHNVYAKLDVGMRAHLHEFKALGDSALPVFLAIALHADQDGRAHPSIGTLARETGYAPHTVSTTIAKLLKANICGQRILLAYQRQSRTTGAFASNQFIILPSVGELAEFEISPHVGKRHTAAPHVGQPHAGQPYAGRPHAVDLHAEEEPEQTRTNSNQNQVEVGVGDVPRTDKNAPAPDSAFFADALRYFGVGEPKRTTTARKLAEFARLSGKDRVMVLRGVWRVFRQAQGAEDSGRLRNGIGWAIRQCEGMNAEALATDDEAFQQVLDGTTTPAAQLLSVWQRGRKA